MNKGCLFFFQFFRVLENHDGTSSSWCQVFHTEMQRIDGHAPWICGMKTTGGYPFSHESMGSVENGPRKNERKRLILEKHPFSFHGFQERFPWRKVYSSNSFRKGQPHIPYRSLLRNSSFTLKADGTQSDDPASETGSHPYGLRGRSWTKLPGSRVFPLLI